MSGFKLISNDEIELSLQGVTRQYLVGNLKKVQALQHLHDEKLEIGITNYESYKTELAHSHTVATEYQYVISGSTMYLDLDTSEEFVFSQGDFYVIPPETKYAQKSKPDTKILFIKAPSINDKVSIDTSEQLAEWFEKDF